VRDAERRGWAIDIGNINHGISTVAAAICDRDGAVRFVLSASIFSGRESEEGFAAFGRALAEQADGLAARVYGATKDKGERL
jgi:DNA-binding IclR family transcriptional regulator